MKTAIQTLALSAWLAAAGPVQAQAPEPLQVRSWAASCASCHGTDGRAQPGMALLAGASKDDLVKKMLDFKAGRRPASVMHQLAKGYSDEQIEAIAAYFAAQKN